MTIDNDTRGWIMTCVSGIACVLGAGIICIDVVVRLFPGKKQFKIQDSHVFLSASLSLSFGVMLFSALYSMLPSADTSLKKGGFSPRAAAYLVIGYFLGGVITIQILSRFLHQYMPTEIVDCDHEHEDSKEGGEHHHHKLHDKGSSHRPGIHGPETNQDSEHTPLLSTKTGGNKHTQANGGHTSEQTNGSILRGSLQGHRSSTTTSPLPRRPSIRSRLTGRVSSFMSVEKTMCGKDGPCYGYTDPCGQPYTKYLPLTVSDKHRFNLPSRRWKPNLSRSATAPFMQSTHAESLEGIDEESAPYGDSQVLGSSIGSGSGQTTAAHSLNKAIEDGRTASGPSSATTGEYEEGEQNGNRVAHPTKHEAQSHHHHVPTNAFLSIGLQTSIAIALHKLPEGFITYATNHANPKLGFAVFMALFIHNITEGFAMALPLFLALGSRWKAIFWSSLLGGVSQPLGAGVAALWLKLAGKSDMAPGEGVYGAMFAVTAGIMTSVALQLFSEGLGLDQNRTLCIIFAFTGMGILGISFALTAE